MVNAVQLHEVIKSRLLTPAQGDKSKVGMYEEQFHAFMQGQKKTIPGWMNDIRHYGIARFAELGFPTAAHGIDAGPRPSG